MNAQGPLENELLLGKSHNNAFALACNLYLFVLFFLKAAHCC